MDVHRRVGTYTVREAHWFKSSFTGNNAPFNTNGIQCIYKWNENKRTKFVYTWVFTEIFVLYTSKIDMYIKELDMYKEIIMYIKEFGTYTVREAHDRLRNSRRNEFGFIFKSDRSWKKECKFVEKFWKDLESVFERWSILTRSLKNIWASKV